MPPKSVQLSLQKPPHSSPPLPPSDLASRIAQLVVRRPVWVIAAVVVLLAGCLWILKKQQRFDSEVLNLLPARFDSVQALKALNNEFTQARELTFALHSTPDSIANFEAHFIESLQKEPWVQRVFAGSPMENPEDLDVLQKLVPPLLLNLDDAAFSEALQELEPATISARMQRLRAEIEANSPRAEIQLATDPLGLLARAMKPMANVSGMEKGQSLGAADGTLRVVPVVTRQPTLSQPDCKALMDQVEDFQRRVRASWEGPAPEIRVTGRAAYVAQISTSMERDVTLTSTVSILVVSGLFYLGFRRVLPLIGITLLLALSCFVAFAIGCLLFENLNMIAIAFCSILVGLGDDFSLLLYNRYLRARADQADHESAVAVSIRDVGKGIFYVSLTTGIGFLVLLLSGSGGFAQLGTLIAIGIVLCAAMMITLLFLFVRPQYPVERRDPFRAFVDGYVRAMRERPVILGLPMTAAFLAVLLFAALPLLPVQFDTSPRSLEPKQSPAAQTLKLITDKIPAVSEPVVLLVEAENAQEAHDRWTTLTNHLQKLVEAGTLQGFSSPVALMLSPEQIRRNQEKLRQFDLAASRDALGKVLQEQGFNAESFQGAFNLLQALERSAQENASFDFRTIIPEDSSWWFLIDRYFSSRPNVATAYVRPAAPLTTPEAQEQLEHKIKEAGVPLKVTGWGYAMMSLVPWAKRELVTFTAGVGGLILLVLAFAYREWRAWLIHTASLVFAICATVATLKVAQLHINMLNALAFPLILGVGVDYGMHILFALRDHEDAETSLGTVLKPLIISGFTTIAGFGSLMLAKNPALSGLGTLCALGVLWCLVSSVLFIIPVFHLWNRKRGLQT